MEEKEKSRITNVQMDNLKDLFVVGWWIEF